MRTLERPLDNRGSYGARELRCQLANIVIAGWVESGSRAGRDIQLRENRCEAKLFRLDRLRTVDREFVTIKHGSRFSELDRVKSESGSRESGSIEAS